MSGSGRFSISDVYPSGLLLCASIRSVSAEENLHKGFIGMGVSDVTPPMINVARDRFHLGCRRGYGTGVSLRLTRMQTWLLSWRGCRWAGWPIICSITTLLSS
ncbi:hypothetical protein BHM03_00046784 [Ensete ventricosum]|nr:hypothetical protein BHM03_00046784 [Ensete ventricosum]